AALDGFDAEGVAAGWRRHLDHLTNPALQQGLTDWRLRGDTAFPWVHLAWTDDGEGHLLVVHQAVQADHGSQVNSLSRIARVDAGRLKRGADHVDAALDLAEALLSGVVGSVLTKVLVSRCALELFRHLGPNRALQVPQFF